MSSLTLATLGVGGDVAQLASVGVVDALPPLPITVVLPVPAPQPADVRPFNPRPPPDRPGNDRGLHLLARPECSLAEDMAEVVDDLRQMLVDEGLRPYEVRSVVVRWSGGERHRGTPSVVFERPFLPIPRVHGISGVARDLRPGGTVKRGTVTLTGISPRYTLEDILELIPRDLQRGEEHFIEISLDKREGNPARLRYVVSGTPERRPLDWTVKLTKQDENRDRSGRPQ